ncbi:hypothetical protein IKJ53_02600, partial [bacterium]|nr:hypothetical protein [bacterium]
MNFTSGAATQSLSLLLNTSGYLRDDDGYFVDANGDAIENNITGEGVKDLIGYDSKNPGNYSGVPVFKGVSAGYFKVNGLNPEENIINAYDRNIQYLGKIDDEISSVLTEETFRHSVFVLNEKTNLTIKGVTIKNAYRGNHSKYEYSYKTSEGKTVSDQETILYEDFEFTKGCGSVIAQITKDSNIYLEDVYMINNDSYGKGGAIYAIEGFTINAVNHNVLFADNRQNNINKDTAIFAPGSGIGSLGMTANDIYLDVDSDVTMNLNAATGKVLQIKSGIEFTKGYKLTLDVNSGTYEDIDTGNILNTSNTGNVFVGGTFGNNVMEGSNVPNYAYDVDINVYAGGFGFVDSETRLLSINNFNIYNDIHYHLDIDLSESAVRASDTLCAKNLNFMNDSMLLITKDSFHVKGNLFDYHYSQPNYLAVELKVLDVNEHSSNYIKLLDENGDSWNSISWTVANQDKPYYAQLGINGTIIFGVSLDDTQSLLYRALMETNPNKKYNSFKMISSYMMYGIYDITQAGDEVKYIENYLTLQRASLTINGQGAYAIKTNNQLTGFVVPETTKPRKLSISKVTEISGFNGALINYGGNITTSGTSFRENISDTYGSVARNEAGNLTISGTAKSYVDIERNHSNEYAGAIYNKGTFTAKYVNFGRASVSVDKSTNTSGIGGAIYNEAGKVTLTNANFVENSAETLGGAIYSTGVLTATSNKFIDNTAQAGGAIYQLVYLDDSAKVTTSKSTFSGNTAKIRNEDIELAPEGAEEPYISASADGGAIYSLVYIVDSSSTF